jgi:hypothetical protein
MRSEGEGATGYPKIVWPHERVKTKRDGEGGKLLCTRVFLADYTFYTSKLSFSLLPREGVRAEVIESIENTIGE